jgi:hypothetical protein
VQWIRLSVNGLFAGRLALACMAMLAGFYAGSRPVRVASRLQRARWRECPDYSKALLGAVSDFTSLAVMRDGFWGAHSAGILLFGSSKKFSSMVTCTEPFSPGGASASAGTAKRLPSGVISGRCSIDL